MKMGGKKKDKKEELEIKKIKRGFEIMKFWGTMMSNGDMVKAP